MKLIKFLKFICSKQASGSKLSVVKRLNQSKYPQASSEKSYFEMIVEAIKHLNMGESGSSKQAIVKMVRENYALGEKAANEGVKAAPREKVTNNNLCQRRIVNSTMENSKKITVT